MYLYHAHAVALGGTVERPAQQIIPALGACSLALSGGTGSAREGSFDNGLVSFDSAQSDLTGSIETRNNKTFYVTSVSVAMYGLNIRNVLMADQIVLRIACDHEAPADPGKGMLSPPWGEPSIITTGCHFDNLKIAGHLVKVDMDHQIFKDFPTHDKLQSGWEDKKDKTKRRRITASLMGSSLEKAKLKKEDPQHLNEAYRGFDEQRNAPELKETVVCSFVKTVDGINGGEIDNWGPIIRIPQFGTIYLGEVICRQGHRRVNMFRLHLGSPDGGTVNGPSGGGNGGGFP